MNNSNKITVLCISAFVMFAGCHRNSYSDYFNGEIRNIEDSIKSVKRVTLQAVPLNGAYYGYMAVYDSLMIFMNPKLPVYFFQIFNVDTGEEIGSFCRKGGGPGEMISVNPVFQFFKENGDLKTLLFAPNESKLLIWNISISVAQGTTVMDTIISYNPRDKSGNVQYNDILYQGKDMLFAKRVSSPLNEREATTPFYEQRTMYSDKLLRKYTIYKKDTIRISPDAAIIPEAFYSSRDALKPDGSKIVLAMGKLPQLNVLDTHTGEVVGYRMKDGPGFSFFETKMIDWKGYYMRIQADDNFIYTSWWGKEPWGRNETPPINTIFMLDWNGNFLNEFITDQYVHEIWLDQFRNRLYTTNMTTDEVFYLDLNRLNIK